MHLRVPVPPLAEQKEIALYLDQETSQIDALISKKEQLIEKLLERRQAVIDSAMTKDNIRSFDSNAKATKVKYLAILNPSANKAFPARRSGDASFVTMALISDDGQIDTSNGRPFEELVGKYSYFLEGDVLIAKVTPCFENGKAAVASKTINGHGFATTEVSVFSPKSERGLDSKFLLYCLLQTYVREEGKSQMTGAGGLQRVPDAVLANVPILLPDLSSQKRVVESIEKKLSSIDNLVLKTRTALKLLKERRQALITQVVTGKIDVRGFAGGNS
jgi:type I restriction enzyme S subunit